MTTTQAQTGGTKGSYRTESGAVMLPLHRMSWEYINEPEEKTNDKGKKVAIYRYQAWVPGDADMDACKELYEEAKIEKWSKGVPEHKKDDFIKPYRRAKAKDYHQSPQLLEMKEAAGGLDPWIINLKSYGRAPGLRKLAPGKKRIPCVDGDIYSGVWVIASVSAYAYDNQSVGVAFSLQNILKLRDDTPLSGGGIDADTEFAEVTGDEYDIEDNGYMLEDGDELDI